MIESIKIENEILLQIKSRLNNLNSRKNSLTPKEYKTEYKQIAKFANKELKAIRKKYPSFEEIQEYLQKD